MAVAYNYSSVAGLMRLIGAHSNSTGTLAVDTVTGLPSPPFKVVIDAGLPSEEICKVTNVAGTNLTVTRGWDGTSAVSHNNAAEVRHMYTAEDARLSRQHEDSTTAHGTTSAVVGLADAQTLTNKTFQAAAAETPLRVQQSGASVSSLTDWLTSGGSVRAKVDTLGLYLRTAIKNVVELMNGDGEAANFFVARLSPQVTTSDGLRVAMPAASTGKAVAVSLGGADVARIESDGDIVTSGSVTATGAVTGSGLTVNGNASVTGNETVTGSVTAGSVSTAGTLASGALTATTGAFTGTVSAPSFSATGTGTFTGGVSSPQTTFRGNEGSVVGSAPSSGTPAIHRHKTVVASSDSNGYIDINFDAFSNGVVVFHVNPGDNGAFMVPLPSAGFSTLGKCSVRLYNGSGSILTNFGPVRLNMTAVGW